MGMAGGGRGGRVGGRAGGLRRRGAERFGGEGARGLLLRKDYGNPLPIRPCGACARARARGAVPERVTTASYWVRTMVTLSQ